MTISKSPPGLNSEQDPPGRSVGPEEGATVPVLAVCNRCHERLRIEINLEEIKSKLKGGLFSIEVPHGVAPNAHSAIFYLSLTNDQIQVRDQVTADHIVGTVSEKQEASPLKPASELPEIVIPDETQKTPKNISEGILRGGLFLGGLGASLLLNYDFLSSLIIATYLSFIVTYGVNIAKRKRSSKHTKERTLELDRLEGTIIQEPEFQDLIIANNKTSRLLTIYQLLRGDSSELPQPLINLALSQHIPLVFTNEGNSYGFLAVENVLKRGAKKKHGAWIHPDLSEKMRETIQHRASLVEAVLQAGGVVFDRISQPTGVLRLLNHSSPSDRSLEE